MKRSIVFGVVGLVVLFSFAFIFDDPNETLGINSNHIATAIDSKTIDGNYIKTWFRNNGSFHRDPATGNSGFNWPISSNKILTYASGLWLATKSGNDTLVSIAEYDYEYLPGYVDPNGNPHGKDDPVFHVYKIVKGDTLGSDYVNWPVNQGAYLDENGKPFLPGSQTLFFSMTDGYPESHGNIGGSTAPLKAQIQVTTWCYNNFPETQLRNVNFTEFKIINKSNVQWTDAVVSVWSDACSNEFVALGCDTTLDLAFAYCRPNSVQYDSTPPAFGFVLLQGPVVQTGNQNDTVYSYVPGMTQRRIRVGYKELGLTSFCPRNNANPIIGDPHNYKETYLILQGYTNNGNSYINPITNQPTKFPYSGDPETNTGWNQYSAESWGNRRYNMNFGFINVNSGDTQTILLAKLVSRGSNNLNSVTKLKSDAVYLKQVFAQNFTTVGVNQISNTIPEGFRLHQNYPNPFNPATRIKFDIPSGSSDEITSVKIFDALGREAATLVQQRLSPGTYETEFNAGDIAGGVYFCRITHGGFSRTIKMVVLK